MADSVDTLITNNNDKYYCARWTNISDGTGESAVVKIDISALTRSDGAVCTRTRLVDLWWNIQGITSVRLYWDHTTDDEIMVISGSGRIDFSGISGLTDPASTGGTGDVLLTTNGAVNGGTYSIVSVWEKLY